MPVPSSNINMSDIFDEANSGFPPSDLSASDLFKKSYFEGPSGSFNIGFNGWGQYGNTSGADRIYGLSASNTNNNFYQFASLNYFYDNSVYANYVDCVNNLPTPVFPAPPFDNDITVTCKLYDSTGTYVYSQFSQLITATGSVSQIFSLVTEPMIAIGYWEVTFQPFSGSFGGTTCNISIQNTLKVSGGTINAAGATTFDWNTYGTEAFGNSSSGYEGYYFDISIG
jgi:phage baseplate assembly protein gpV